MARDAGKIIMRDMLGGLAGSEVPAWAEFAAAADVGQRVEMSLFEPQPAGDAQIGRRQRDFEAAIAVKNGRSRRSIRREILADQKIRNVRAVVGDGVALLHLDAGAVERGGGVLERLGCAISVPQRRRGR